MCSVERIATELPDVLRPRPLALAVDADDVRRAPRALGAPSVRGEVRERLLPERVLLAVAAHREADLAERVLRAHQHLGLRDRRAVLLVSAENVIQPANMWPSGVISVNETSSE